MTQQEIMQVASELLNHDDILATLIAVRSLNKVFTAPGCKIKDLRLLTIIDSAMKNFFSIISDFHVYGMDTIDCEIGEKTLMIYPVTQNVILIVIVEALANRGLLEVEVENARRKIKEIIKKQQAEQVSN